MNTFQKLLRILRCCNSRSKYLIVLISHILLEQYFGHFPTVPSNYQIKSCRPLQLNFGLNHLTIDLFTTRHKVVHNGGPLNFKGLLCNKKTNYLAQILQSLSYKMCSVIIPKFNKIELFVLILGTSAIMDQTACCYNVTTSETGLHNTVSPLKLHKKSLQLVHAVDVSKAGI